MPGAAASNQSGQVQSFKLDAGGLLWSRTRNYGNTGWNGPWVQTGPATVIAELRGAILSPKDLCIWVFGVNAFAQDVYLRQSTPNGTWADPWVVY